MKYVSVPTENWLRLKEGTSCRETGLKVAMNRKGREVPEGP
jgi:hypothetical protein